MEIWNWLTRLWFGDEASFGAAMKVNPTRMIGKIVIFMMVVIAIVALRGYLYTFGSNFAPDRKSTTPSVSIGTNSGIVQTGANSSATLNVNKKASSYTWANPYSPQWKTEHVSDGYQTQLDFVADSNIPFPRICLYLIADQTISHVNIIGNQSGAVYTPQPSKQFIYCTDNNQPGNPSFLVTTEEIPDSFTAKLLNNEDLYPQLGSF